MPFLVPFIPAIVGAGVGIYSASQQGKAAKDSLNAQNAAADKQLADQKAARDQAIALEQPFVNAGQAGLSPLLQRLGVNSGLTQGVGANDPATANLFDRRPAPQPGPSTAKAGGGMVADPASAGPRAPTGPVAPDYASSDAFPTPSGPQGPPQGAAASGPNWDAYIAANPDVAAWIQSGHGDPSLGPNQTPEQAAAYQFQNSGQGEGRSAPPDLTPAPAQTAADPNAPPEAPPTWQGNPTDSSGAPIFTRGANGSAPDQSAYFGGSAPDQSAFFSNFQTSPGYQWRLSQGQRNLNANSAARGLGQSGSAIQGAIDYGQNQASAEYGNWFNQQNTLFNNANNQFNTKFNQQNTLFNNANSQFNTANQRTDANFNSDRGYGTDLFVNERNNAQSRYDTNTGNLFDLAQMGQRAAGATASAGQTYADNSSKVYGAQANADAAAAQQRASANSSAFGALGAAAGNVFAQFGGGGTSGNIGTATQPSYAGGY